MQEDDPFLRACTQQFTDKHLLNFVKPMGRKGKPITYDWYAESEWRIIFREQLLPFPSLLIDPRDPKNVEHHSYFNSLTTPEQDKLKYLVPLDGWFQLIIYPSLWVKSAAQQDRKDTIQAEIQRIKNLNDHGNRVEGGNWPMEIDLDACRNF